MLRFRPFATEDAPMILRWRTSPHVTKYQYTDVPNDLSIQQGWVDKVVATKAPYWIIELDSVPIGVINLASIETSHYRTSFGFYIGEKEYRWAAVGVLKAFYDRTFSGKLLDTSYFFSKITAEVMAENSLVINLHVIMGFRNVGVMRKHIYKDDKFHDVVYLELSYPNWKKSRFSSDSPGEIEWISFMN